MTPTQFHENPALAAGQLWPAKRCSRLARTRCRFGVMNRYAGVQLAVNGFPEQAAMDTITAYHDTRLYRFAVVRPHYVTATVGVWSLQA